MLETTNKEVAPQMFNKVTKYVEPEIVNEKAIKTENINNITVTTTNGNTFDGDDISRANMNEAIQAASVLGITSHNWKLANNTIVNVTLDELKEALALAIQAKGAIILGQ